MSIKQSNLPMLILYKFQLNKTMPCLSFNVYRDKSDIIIRSIIGQNKMFKMLT